MIGKAVPESEFTRPSGWCPEPHRWHATDDHSTEIEVSALIAGMVRGLQPDVVVETGAAWGQTAEAIGLVLRGNGHGHLWSLEVDPERVAYARKRCDGLPVTVLEQSSLEFTPPDGVGLAFFDSLFPTRVPEFERYRPHMAQGCVVVFHDSAPLHGGGQFPDDRDLMQTLNLLDIPLLHLRTPRGVTIGQVW